MQYKTQYTLTLHTPIQFNQYSPTITRKLGVMQHSLRLNPMFYIGTIR